MIWKVHGLACYNRVLLMGRSMLQNVKLEFFIPNTNIPEMTSELPTLDADPMMVYPPFNNVETPDARAWLKRYSPDKSIRKLRDGSANDLFSYMKCTDCDDQNIANICNGFCNKHMAMCTFCKAIISKSESLNQDNLAMCSSVCNVVCSVCRTHIPSYLATKTIHRNSTRAICCVRCSEQDSLDFDHVVADPDVAPKWWVVSLPRADHHRRSTSH